MSRLGEKIADEIPDSWIEFIQEHPRVVYAASVPLLVFCAYNLIRAARLHAMCELFVAGRVGDIQRAASEGLGG